MHTNGDGQSVLREQIGLDPALTQTLCVAVVLGTQCPPRQSRSVRHCSRQYPPTQTRGSAQSSAKRHCIATVARDRQANEVNARVTMLRSLTVMFPLPLAPRCTAPVAGRRCGGRRAYRPRHRAILRAPTTATTPRSHRGGAIHSRPPRAFLKVRTRRAQRVRRPRLVANTRTVAGDSNANDVAPMQRRAAAHAEVLSRRNRRFGVSVEPMNRTIAVRNTLVAVQPPIIARRSLVLFDHARIRRIPMDAEARALRSQIGQTLKDVVGRRGASRPSTLPEERRRCVVPVQRWKAGGFVRRGVPASQERRDV